MYGRPDVKEPRAIEVINGRAAMIGWMLALQDEITLDHSLMRQVINTRTFTLADGVVKSSTFPAGGLFLIPLTVLVVIAASLAPVLRGRGPHSSTSQLNLSRF